MNNTILSGTQALTNDALADVHRLHDIVHPARPGGVHEPGRNPGGCDATFCTMILPELPAVAEPAIRADENRKLGNLATVLRFTVADLDEHIRQKGKEIAAPHIAQAEADAAARVTELENTLTSERQRHEDLTTELRRQIRALERQNERPGGEFREAFAPARAGGATTTTHERATRDDGILG